MVGSIPREVAKMGRRVRRFESPRKRIQRNFGGSVEWEWEWEREWEEWEVEMVDELV